MAGRVGLLGVEIDALDMDATVARCDELILAGGFAEHMAVNAAKLVTLQADERLREIVRNCTLVSADGQSVVWAARLLALAEAKGYRVFILGARSDVLERAVGILRKRHPSLAIAGHRDGWFSDDQTQEVCDEIRAAGADLLFVAMSSPRKEYFLGEHGEGLGVPFAMGVGGAIDVVAGVTRRAPASWQRLGLEWLFRLLQEPKRMFRRYAVTNARFMVLIGRALVGRRAGA